ncbi:BCD family MFS transporter [Fulvimarina sp. 2208YS6-2-32]|uniref:BCD family MFS transporter n=1 Tax=Fulvimarina uroteuthidis TaxID=3098149 RepID=A0ABU5I120_9HYPH|nr:BCD family MFS transporter [Fulvimarina sp. 2208YS6-2-32]MDY8108504.1 BCD family MFS transporter [Fulvimarina sp. 2208YS6-2-32]
MTPALAVKPDPAPAGFTWPQLMRLALVQTAIGAMVVITTSTLNRVMVIEHGFAATVPGALVALHYAVQMLRPRFGHGADTGRGRTGWIVGGLAVLAVGTIGAAAATGLAASHPLPGLLASALAFVLIGAGVGAAGTNLLALVAQGTAAHRRGQAATLMWTLMIAGFAVTAGTAGHFLDPFSDARLLAVTGVVAGLAFLVSALSIRGIEQPSRAVGDAAPRLPRRSSAAFRAALASVWREDETRRFTLFVFISMFAYNAQDLILEPFAGSLFAMSPGETTQLSGAQHGGTFAGMIAVALAGWLFARRFPGLLRILCVAGCIGSASAFGLLYGSTLQPAGESPGAFPLSAVVTGLGFFNGVFAVAAIGSMMGLSARTEDTCPRHGIRMGLWGAAQAIAFGLGGFAGTALVDLVQFGGGSPATAYGSVFAVEAVCFLISGALAWVCVADRSAAPRSAGPPSYSLPGATA